MHIVLKELQDSNYGGVNTYLSDRHFSMMLGVAAMVHVLALLAYALTPSSAVLDIPVRVLHVKLAGPSLAGIREEKKATSATAAPLKEGAKNTPNPSVQSAPVKAPKTKQKLKSAAPAAVAVPSPQPVAKNTQSKVSSAPSAVNANVAEKAKMLSAPTTAPAPKRFVRNGNAPAGAGSIYGNSNLSETELVRRYEQILSLWIEQHKVYPAAARRQQVQGNAMVRIRIDRGGNILRYRLEQPTGHALIDNAIGQMIASANPVPSVPENYPAGKEIEFLVPVSFRVME